MPNRVRLAASSVALCAAAAVPFASLSPAGASTGGSGQGAPQGGYQTIVVQLSGPAVRASSVVSGIPESGLRGDPHLRYSMRVPTSDAASALQHLGADQRVRYASVAQPVRAAESSTPNDPCYIASCTAETGAAPPSPPDLPANQAYLQTIGAPAAWAVTHGEGTTVAVLDSGVDSTHPDLDGASGGGNKIVGLHDFCNISSDPQCADNGPTANDLAGHGTHVAGIVGADTGNGIGVASLGWAVNLDIYKVLDSSGAGLSSDVADAIYAAVDAGDRVINLSLANYSCAYVNANRLPSYLCGPDQDTATAVEYALAHNAVVVAAAGNDGYDSAVYPASYPGVLSVAATDNQGTVQCYSEWGSAANIAAPGGTLGVGNGIVSTWNDGNYETLVGTSMAAPQVAAAAALMISNDPSLTGPQITELLEDTASPTGGSAGCGPGATPPSQSPASHPINGGLLDVPAALAAEAHPPAVFDGYDLAGSDGSVYPFGNSIHLGDLGSTPLNQPIVGMARDADGLGYLLAARDGGVFQFGDARFFGSTGGVKLNQPIVGIAADPATGGYWLVASDGGVFNFNAPFFGSLGAIHLNKPIVGIAAMPDGSGYWLVASDGGIFQFGRAPFYGSTGAVRLNKPIVGMAPTPSGNGYWLVASDGGIFQFGRAGFFGSTGAVVLNKPIVSMAASPTGAGYWLVASDGGTFQFGDARFQGSLGGLALPAPVVAASN